MHSNNESPESSEAVAPSENDTQQQLLADLEQLKAAVAQRSTIATLIGMLAQAGAWPASSQPIQCSNGKWIT